VEERGAPQTKIYHLSYSTRYEEEKTDLDATSTTVDTTRPQEDSDQITH